MLNEFHVLHLFKFCLIMSLKLYFLKYMHFLLQLHNSRNIRNKSKNRIKLSLFFLFRYWYKQEEKTRDWIKLNRFKLFPSLKTRICSLKCPGNHKNKVEVHQFLNYFRICTYLTLTGFLYKNYSK